MCKGNPEPQMCIDATDTNRYNTPGFLEKNADTLKDEVRDIMSASTASEFIRHLLPPVSEDVKSGRVKRSTVARCPAVHHRYI